MKIFSSSASKLTFASGILILFLGTLSAVLFQHGQETKNLLVIRDRLQHQENLVDSISETLDTFALIYRDGAEAYLLGDQAAQESFNNIVHVITPLENIAGSESAEVFSYINKAQTALIKAQKAGKGGISDQRDKFFQQSFENLLASRRTVENIDQKLEKEIALVQVQVTSRIENQPFRPIWVLLISVTSVGAFLAVLVFDLLLPLKNITTRMVEVSSDTDNAEQYKIPDIRPDEIGRAEKAFNDLLSGFASSIKQIRNTEALATKRLAAIEASGDGIAVIDPEGHLVYANKAMAAFQGLGVEKLSRYIGRPWVRLFPGDDRKYLAEKVLPAVYKTGRWQAEMEFTRQDGHKVWGDITLTVLEDGGLISTVRDITNRKEIERERSELQELNARAQKMQAIGELTGGVAHDFNNMLTAIAGNLEMIEEVGVPAESAPRLAAAQRAVSRGAELTHRLLSFSRKQILRPVSTNVNSLIPETMQLISRTVGQNIDLTLDLSPSVWPVFLDQGQLENALVNLCLNARDAMPEGGNLTIGTKNETVKAGHYPPGFDGTPGDYVVITVTDKGTGIAPEALSRIFDPFFTTKHPEIGTGLGLSMVYGFVKQSQGHISVSSVPGEGTSVSLYLRRDKIINEQAGHRGKENKENLPVGTETILLVEDEPDLLDLAATALNKLGYHVITAQNGTQATDMLPTLPELDLLLTDLMMPGGVSGVDLAHKVRSFKPEVKVLFVSGYASKYDEDLKKLPQAKLLAKPYSTRLLAEMVRESLDSIITA